MKIAVVGGGPAGLYFATLVKRFLPVATVELFERHAKTSRPGFGVTFTDAGLRSLAQRDDGIAISLREQMQRWKHLRIVHRDVAMPIEGNGCGAIGSDVLRDALCRMAERSSVLLHFETEVDDVRDLADRDLVVVAEGIGSPSRERYRAVLGARARQLSNRVIRFRTNKPLDCLTVSFRTFEGGNYVGHHFRHSRDLSTLVIECDARTWERADLAAMDETACRKYCTQIFALDLEGSRLLPGASPWRQFAIVESERWHHRNILFLGDAAYTVHYSLGAGARLAMEGAIALAEACREHAPAVPAILAAFDEKLRPLAERFVAISRGSAEWYEGFAEQMNLPPLDFAHSFMTRSGQFTEQKLRKTAPYFWRNWQDGLPDDGAD